MGCLRDYTFRQNFEHYVVQMLQTWASYIITHYHLSRDSTKNVEIFKNNTAFLIFTNMFRRHICHRQCDGYESLQWFKTCLLQIIRYIALENNTLDKFRS